jgi:hypothetical protein
MTRKLTTHSSWLDYYEVLHKLEPFKTSGALFAEGKHRDTIGSWSVGRLHYAYHATLRKADYVVYSYDTPIAWHVPDVGWAMPDESYSKTTTRHQNKIRTALDSY